MEQQSEDSQKIASQRASSDLPKGLGLELSNVERAGQDELTFRDALANG